MIILLQMWHLSFYLGILQCKGIQLNGMETVAVSTSDIVIDFALSKRKIKLKTVEEIFGFFSKLIVLVRLLHGLQKLILFYLTR